MLLHRAMVSARQEAPTEQDLASGMLFACRFRLRFAYRDTLAEQLDALVASGRFDTKARRGPHGPRGPHRRRAAGGRRAPIVEGYRRVPQDEADVAAAHHAATRSIDEEPW